MGFLVDTSVWIALERGNIEVADLAAITKQHPVYLSPVNIAELRYGLELVNDPVEKQNGLRMLRKLHRKPLLRITGETGEIFGRLAAKLSQGGRGAAFRIQDVWLASRAIQRDFKLLTANAKDFKDIPGLKWVEVKI